MDLNTTASRLQYLLDESGKLHGHLCPRQVLGVRMGMLAADLLHLDLPQKDKRLLTIVETDGCFADGISSATGCSLGHRTLRCIDHGKIAATFIDTVTGEAVRIHPSAASRALASQNAPNAPDRWHAYLEGYQRMPTEELLVVNRVALNCPVETLVSSPDCRKTCVNCREEIFNEREVMIDGQILCRSCAGQPYLTLISELPEQSDGR
jgi:formylmethanofuran dehydrogenase subunit E